VNTFSGGFRPTWWATTGTILLGAAFAAAGFWQLSRAAEKRDLLRAFEAGAAAQPVPAPAAEADVAALRYRAIRATGHYDAAHQVLLDARTRAGQAGYEVLTPLRSGHRAILVNRGWVPANPDRAVLPDITTSAGERTVTGLLDHLPRAALTLSGVAAGPSAVWPQRMLYPAAGDIGRALGYAVADYQLLLGPDEPDGYLRDWRPAALTPRQHLGYAVQWFALAVTLVVIYALSSFRRAAPGPDRS
jgi:surfeit locus 1 family protein